MIHIVMSNLKLYQFIFTVIVYLNQYTNAQTNNLQLLQIVSIYIYYIHFKFVFSVYFLLSILIINRL